MAETQLVTLRHRKEDIIVPELILRACSPVLDGILRDTSPPDDGGNKLLTIDDVEVEALEIFVDMLTANSYAPTNISILAKLAAIGLRSAYLATRVWLFMPLIHKYDCKGLLMHLQEAVNTTSSMEIRDRDSESLFKCLGFARDSEEALSRWFGFTAKADLFDELGQSIATMLRYDTEDTSQWMTASTMNCLAAHLSSGHRKSDYAQMCRAKLDGLPRAVLADLLVHVFTKTPPAGEGGADSDISDVGETFSEVGSTLDFGD